MESLITIFLILLGLYVIFGLLFALYFAFGGAHKIDPLMKGTKKVVRILLFPGVVATWPFLLKKILKPRTR